jgi:hypothetical protein
MNTSETYSHTERSPNQIKKENILDADDEENRKRKVSILKCPIYTSKNNF